MRRAKGISTLLRQKELEDAAFGVFHDILLRDLRGTLMPTLDELATLLAISNCSGASVETRAFASNAWEWLADTGSERPADKLSVT